MADFLREYRLDLLGADRRLGWRRFRILVAGLKHDATFWVAVESDRRVEAARPLEGKAAERLAERFFGGG